MGVDQSGNSPEQAYTPGNECCVALNGAISSFEPANNPGLCSPGNSNGYTGNIDCNFQKGYINLINFGTPPDTQCNYRGVCWPTDLVNPSNVGVCKPAYVPGAM
jgi:hypothetical protein